MIIFYLVDYVQELYDTICNASGADLKFAAGKLTAMTPTPVSSSLDKQSKDEAVKKALSRRNITIDNVPPTTSGTVYMYNLLGAILLSHPKQLSQTQLPLSKIVWML